MPTTHHKAPEAIVRSPVDICFGARPARSYSVYCRNEAAGRRGHTPAGERARAGSCPTSPARARTPPRKRSTSAACRPRVAASGPRDRSSTSALGSQPGTSNPADVYFGRAETILNGWANVRLRDRAHVEHRIARVVEIDHGVIDEILIARQLARRGRGPLQLGATPDAQLAGPPRSPLQRAIGKEPGSCR